MKKLLYSALIIMSLASCSKDSSPEDKCTGKTGGGGLVNLLVSPSDDIAMGQATVNSIDSNKTEYPILDSTQYNVAYGHINRITKNILNSGEVYYKDKFVWRVRIIKRDDILNAFCTPGGFIYVYTGLIKYLDNETQLAGVLGHEIAHADRRHSANQMVKQYGISTLLSIISGGNQSQLATLSAQLLLLKYSREDETEADKFSVRYLKPTEYDGRGAKYFFEKLIATGQSGGTPAFLSTHPDPGDRVANITQTWECLGSKVGLTFDTRYAQFKTSLP
ncbi:MAG: M48 family metalloprotease [Bacteroidetes bacterium]|nr:M48 family metalloprotease [Bacteroidota bacterium]